MLFGVSQADLNVELFFLGVHECVFAAKIVVCPLRVT